MAISRYMPKCYFLNHSSEQIIIPLPSLSAFERTSIVNYEDDPSTTVRRKECQQRRIFRIGAVHDCRRPRCYRDLYWAYNRVGVWQRQYTIAAVNQNALKAYQLRQSLYLLWNVYTRGYLHFTRLFAIVTIFQYRMRYSDCYTICSAALFVLHDYECVTYGFYPQAPPAYHLNRCCNVSLIESPYLTQFDSIIVLTYSRGVIAFLVSARLKCIWSIACQHR
ncbi:hypothetical protein SARC_05237 [Sphaeroforma arctica JP610]|uniref:Uncharacterized protein n=1 Tax=Sphaeroforma arctica JP610 TaxID=667725 RepID=A0A0L0G088_9EUKA|nr:hypothetical protein SARC_05237 [Sphaeroforma arctica JP610]KNC82485.1 hypothetical protein SARC_05237 [Sphaeroforma arctica JP610]|eukprot:XP_014156387.1 hypothetical protein SARC_05237 [Sphaeroforma arctica JP610]